MSKEEPALRMEKEEPAESPAGSDVRYVEVLPTTGWQRMANTVREIDEDKVEDCKDDIDTLLVFAGLYSAVLSAFNVESYTYIIPDPNDQIINLLERIAVQTQSYTITSGSFNSTISNISPAPAFAAPLWAIRVNGLWFASLIVSLATASLSMLVKQWLREFLAVQYRTPQQRLRAHQYRKFGLEKWKVFEIAAVLPMLLQVSLGLFFIGLCVFTMHIDERMGLTSVPLVSGWAFFLLATTLAPLFSPRCPYKMPLLKSFMRVMRGTVTMRMRDMFTALVTCGGATTGIISRRDLLFNAPSEEEKMVSTDQDDKDLLLDMDVILADDSLLPTMWEILKQHSDPSQSLSVLMELLINRIGPDADHLRSERLRCIPDLSVLSRRTWETVMDMLAILVRQGNAAKPLVISSPDWLHKATLLLMSKSPYPLPTAPAQCLHDLLSDAPGYDAALSLARWIRPRADEKPFEFRPISDRLCPIYRTIKGPQRESALTVSFMYAELLRPGSQLPSKDIKQLIFPMLVERPELFRDHSATRTMIQDLFTVFVSICDANESKEGSVLGAEEGMAIVMAFSNALGRQPEAVKVLTSNWLSMRYCYRGLVHITRMGQYREESASARARMLELGVDAFMQSPDQVEMLQSATRIAAINATGKRKDSFTVMDAVRFCALYVQLYAKYVKQEQTQQERKDSDLSKSKVLTSKHWEALWKALSAFLCNYWQSKTWTRAADDPWLAALPLLNADELLVEDRKLAAECLSVMESLEAPKSPDSEPPPSRLTIFPNRLVAALGLFIMPEDASDHPRLALLRDQGFDTPADLEHVVVDDSDSNTSSSDDEFRDALQDSRIRQALQEAAVHFGFKKKPPKQNVQGGTGRARGKPQGTDEDPDSDSSIASSIDDELRTAMRDPEFKIAAREAIREAVNNAGITIRPGEKKPRAARRKKRAQSGRTKTADFDTWSTSSLDEDMHSALQSPAFVQTVREVASRLGVQPGSKGHKGRAARRKRPLAAQPSPNGTSKAASSSTVSLDDNLLDALRDPVFRMAVLEAANEHKDDDDGVAGDVESDRE